MTAHHSNFAATKFARQLRGLQYVSRFPAIQMTSQMRAGGCERQGRLVEHMTSTGTIPDLMTGEFAIKTLSNASTPMDIERFRFAPIITATNKRRREINFRQAQSFAATHGLPVVVWKKLLQKRDAESPDVLDALGDPSSMYYGMFVFGASAQMICNVVPHLSIANGTGATMHSLTWHDRAIGHAMRQKILATPPGRIVEVVIPDFVNVVIKSTHELPLPPLEPTHPLFDDTAAAKQQKQFVFPMQRWKVRAAKKKNKTITMPAHEGHQLELGFAFTFHKVQGATLAQLILDLNFKPSNLATFSAVYVGLTRVKSFDDIRLLPVLSVKMREKLAELRFDPHLRDWLEDLENHES